MPGRFIGELLLDCLKIGSSVDDFLPAVQLAPPGIGVRVERIGFDTPGQQCGDAEERRGQAAGCSLHG